MCKRAFSNWETERTRCATARETGAEQGRAAVPVAHPSLSITVDEKRKDCVQSSTYVENKR